MKQRRKITNLVLALVAVAIGTYAQSRIRQPERLNESLVWYGVATVIFVIALRRKDESYEAYSAPVSAGATPANDRGAGTKPAATGRQLGATMLAIVAVLSCAWGLRLFDRDRPPGIAWSFYLFSICLLYTSDAADE